MLPALLLRFDLLTPDDPEPRAFVTLRACLRTRLLGLRDVWIFPCVARDDGQLNLPSGGHAELPGRGQCDYFL